MAANGGPAETKDVSGYHCAVDAGQEGEYTGKLVGGAPGGIGVFSAKTPEGLEWTYTGEFQNGSIQGEGRMDIATGERLEGSFARGRMEGEGRYYVNSAMIYDGSWKNGSYDGEGELYYASGALCYAGGWREGKFDGEGRHYLETGALRYDGAWKDGNMTGRGKYYFDSGYLKYEGEWQGGAIINGRLYNSEGALAYEGPFENGAPKQESLFNRGAYEAVAYQDAAEGRALKGAAARFSGPVALIGEPKDGEQAFGVMNVGGMPGERMVFFYDQAAASLSAGDEITVYGHCGGPMAYSSGGLVFEDPSVVADWVERGGPGA
jgi:hypothetical protein